MGKAFLFLINNSAVLETPEKEFVEQSGHETRSELSAGQMRPVVHDNFCTQKFKQLVHHVRSG